MGKTLGSLLALMALASGILNAVDPMACLSRAGIAFLVGYVAATIWQALLTVSGNTRVMEEVPVAEVAEIGSN